MGAVTLEYLNDFVDKAAVVTCADGPGTAGATLADLRVETRTESAFLYGRFVYLKMARAQRVKAHDEFQQLFRMIYGAVWAEIQGAVFLHPSGQENPRVHICTDTYPRIGLRVFQEDVILRLVLFYQIILEQERIGLGIHHGILRIRYLAHQDPGLGIQTLGCHEILRHPFMQILSLTYINNIPFRVIVSIDSGGMWKQSYFFSNVQVLPSLQPLWRRHEDHVLGWCHRGRKA